MGETTIEYVDRSVNPVRARHKVTGRVGHYCVKVSPGCARCYSSAWQKYRGTGCAFEAKHADEVEVFFEPRAMDEVLRRRSPTRWFWCDMTDFWGAWVRDEWIDQMFAVMALTPHHTHLWPTKRPERMRAYVTGAGVVARIGEVAQAISVTPPPGTKVYPVGPENEVGYPEFGYRWFLPWPLPNVHLGVSVEDQATADERIPLLLQTPAAVRWISYEPALGPVDFGLRRWIRLPSAVRTEIPFLSTTAAAGVYRAESNPHGALSVRATNGTMLGVKPDEFERLPSLDWIVVGGESGPGARPFDLAWARSVIARGKAAGCKVYVKQLGARPMLHAVGGVFLDPEGWSSHVPVVLQRPPEDERYAITLRDRKGGDMAEWPEDLRVREFPVSATMATTEPR